MRCKLYSVTSHLACFMYNVCLFFPHFQCIMRPQSYDLSQENLWRLVLIDILRGAICENWPPKSLQTNGGQCISIATTKCCSASCAACGAINWLESTWTENVEHRRNAGVCTPSAASHWPRPAWNWTQPPSSSEASLSTEKTVPRWFTVALARTLTPGTTTTWQAETGQLWRVRGRLVTKSVER